MTEVGNKLDQARAILRDLGMPAAQQNEISGYTLLSLAGIGPEDSWADSGTKAVRVHDIRLFCASKYEKQYAENTRETFRRQVLHQLVEAGIALYNADDPNRSTNSPNNRYSLNPKVATTLATYGTAEWPVALENVKSEVSNLSEKYARPRQRRSVRATTPDGKEVPLSAGKHNELQRDVVEKLLPTFFAQPKVLYVGDAADKGVHLEQEKLQELGISVEVSTKLPDIIAHDIATDRVVLVEAVTSHGPVSPKRYNELEAAMAGCTKKRVYFTAFPDVGTFRQHAADIAWETEVWLSERPDHLIHFDGEKFISLHGQDEGEGEL